MLYIYEKLKVLNLLASSIIVADFNATGVSVEGYEDDAMAILQTGLISSTSASYVVNIQASTALAGAYTTIASFTSAGSASDYGVASVPVSLKGTDRKFVRAFVDVTGSDTIAGVFGVTLLVRPTVSEAGINTASVA